MGGKPIKLWGALHFLHPDLFTSKWRWADQWLVIEEGYHNHKTIGGLKKGREDEFYAHLAPHAVRRLRTEVLPQLPPKQWVDVWCEMTPTQRKQYAAFAADAEIRIDEYHLSATSILAEYTRLKQFSNARCEVEILGPVDEETAVQPMKLKPTFDSGKLPYLLELLAEQGIAPEEPEGTSQAIVASQFRETIDMVYNYLTEQKIPCIKITGAVKQSESERAQRAFKAGNDNEGLRVVCMVTTIGVGLTLDNVETIHVLDETWNPDDQEQLTDRAVNTTRNHQVTAFMYRSKESIEEYINDVASEKADVNKAILDVRRLAYRAAHT
jgi:SNF2 family DNA or RNA helicase